MRYVPQASLNTTHLSSKTFAVCGAYYVFYLESAAVPGHGAKRALADEHINLFSKLPGDHDVGQGLFIL